MPPDLSIGFIASPAHEATRTVVPITERAFAQAASSSGAAARIATPKLPENRIVLDPASDRVVLEYFDATGALVNSLPSQRQLDAYRLAASAGSAPAPHIKST